MFKLISHLLGEFASKEGGKYKKMAENEVSKLGSLLKKSIEDGLSAAAANVIPLFVSAGLLLFGVIFIAFGAAKFLDFLFYPYDGIGYILVGVIVVFFGFLMHRKHKALNVSRIQPEVRESED